MPQAGNIISQQNISVLSNGPDGANTLFITTGLMVCGLSQNNPTGSGNANSETFSATLDQPLLTAAQFRRAIASASLASINSSFPASASASGSANSCATTSVEAHFDDESGRVQLLVDLQVGAAFGSVELFSIGFFVMTTAAV